MADVIERSRITVLFEGWETQLFTVAKKDEQAMEVAEIVGKSLGKVTPMRAGVRRTYSPGEI